jgi:gluconolactonase
VFAASEGPDGTGITRDWSRMPRRPIIGNSKIDRNATRTREGFTMEMDRGISRRRMLAMSAAAGAALGGDVGRAFAQTDKRIEQLAPELDKIIATSEPIKELATGFGGPLGPAEGPLWWKEGGFLLFTDIHNSRRMKHVPGQAPTVDLEPSNRANGLTRDLQGRLLSCEHDTRRVTRRELDGSLTVLANSFQGRRLNRPNDVVVKSDGAIYFTDPWSSPAAPEQWDLTFAGVYRLTPDLGTLSLLVDNFVFPNGLAFTPDESVLYVNDTRRGHIRAFDVLPNGTLAKQSDRVFADLRGSEPGVPDGMKVDVAGNVYCGGAGGIWILDPQGKKLGRIVHGHPATTNIAFGGDDWKTLYFTSRTHLGSVNLKVAGLPVPAPKKTG